MILLEAVKHVLRLVHGLLFLSLLLSCLWVHAIWIPYVIWIPFFYPKFYRQLGPWVSMVYNYVAFILWYVAGVDTHLTCHRQVYFFMENFFKKSNKKTTMIFLSNHRCRSDWIFLWTCFISFDKINQVLVILMRRLLRYLPLIGWTICTCGIFINRKWEVDGNFLIKYIKVLTSKFGTHKVVLEFFPEGTDLWYKAIEVSNNYAVKMNKQQYQYVLHPRTKGLTEVIRAIREDNLECLTSCTLGYQDFVKDERCNEFLIALGRFPKKVLFHLECYTVRDIIEQYLEFQSIKNNDNYFYVPSNYPENSNEMNSSDNDSKNSRNEENNNNKEKMFGVSNEIYENAIADWLDRTFYQRELRLKDWYENGNWINDDKYKLHLTHVPYATFIITICFNLALYFVFYYLWCNYRWIIWIQSLAILVLSWNDIVAKAFLSHYENMFGKE